MNGLLERYSEVMERQQKLKERLNEHNERYHLNSSGENLKELVLLMVEHTKIKFEVDLLTKEVEKLEACV